MSSESLTPVPALAVGAAWGAGPSLGGEALAARYAHIFTHIRAGAVERELEQPFVFRRDWLNEARRFHGPACTSGCGGAASPCTAEVLDHLSHHAHMLTTRGDRFAAGAGPGPLPVRRRRPMRTTVERALVTLSRKVRALAPPNARRGQEQTITIQTQKEKTRPEGGYFFAARVDHF